MKRIILIFLLSLFSVSAFADAQIFCNNLKPEEVRQKIENNSWADSIYRNLTTKIAPLADRHLHDPNWIISRLAMYWKDGQHYTQCYLKNQNWDYGEGNAPVPTVRMPGMRTWNKYKNVPLEERTPYNETGDMLGLDITDPNKSKVLVPYKESGHMIRGNNVEILTIAEESAFLYWLTSEEKYARLAADIYVTWLIGTYYMNPILDPDGSTGSKGGWEPGGICGYYDYEQIHDDLAMHAAVAYDFLSDYLEDNNDQRILDTGKSLKQISSEVFKRFIDLGMIRGGKNGNWNVNGWNIMLYPILVLGDNKDYADGHGKQYYLDFLINNSTDYHDSMKDIVKSYDSITGLWPEAPGYAFSTISMLLDFATVLSNQDIDIFTQYPILEKAALAVFPWMDNNGNIIVFGDSRGGSANYNTLERLLSYYVAHNDNERITAVAEALNTGISNGSYNRADGTWKSLCMLTDNIPSSSASKRETASFSPFHRLVTLKDKDLMAVVYGGRNGGHLSPNGLAMQLYGFGYALAPDAAAYESYWSKDKEYHQTATGSNTMLPGYVEGEIVINSMWPKIEENNFTSYSDRPDGVKMVDMSAKGMRRIIALIPKKDASGGGYYVDIYRSDSPSSHYLYHNVGKAMHFYGDNMVRKSVEKLDTTYLPGYNWFQNPQLCQSDKIDRIVWEVADSIQMTMHPSSSFDRNFYAVDAPYTTLNHSLTPDGVSTPPGITPTLIISQQGKDAFSRPMVAVFEPSVPQKEYIRSIEELKCDENEVIIRIDFIDGSYDIVSSSLIDGVNYFSSNQNVN